MADCTPTTDLPVATLAPADTLIINDGGATGTTAQALASALVFADQADRVTVETDTYTATLGNVTAASQPGRYSFVGDAAAGILTLSGQCNTVATMASSPNQITAPLPAGFEIVSGSAPYGQWRLSDLSAFGQLSRLNATSLLLLFLDPTPGTHLSMGVVSEGVPITFIGETLWWSATFAAIRV